MDDQVFANLVAEMDVPTTGSTAVVDDPSPSESPEDQSLQQAESADLNDQPETSPEPEGGAPEPETVDWQAEALAARAEIAANQAEQNARREAAEAKLREIHLAEDETRAREFAESLSAADPSWAQQFQQHRYTLAHDRDQAVQRAEQMERGLTALTLAVEHMQPDKVAAIVEEAAGLLRFGGHDEMKRALETRNQRNAEREQAIQEKDRQIAELRLQLDALQRPAAADVVDGGTSGAGGLSFEEAWATADMEDAVNLLMSQPGRSR